MRRAGPARSLAVSLLTPGPRTCFGADDRRRYSNVRPPRGVRWRFTAGASRTCADFLRASRPRRSPTRPMSSGSQVALWTIPTGATTDGVRSSAENSPRTPFGPSDILTAGMPSRSMASVRQLEAPPRRRHFSANVSSASHVAIRCSMGARFPFDAAGCGRRMVGAVRNPARRHDDELARPSGRPGRPLGRSTTQRPGHHERPGEQPGRWCVGVPGRRPNGRSEPGQGRLRIGCLWDRSTAVQQPL